MVQNRGLALRLGGVVFQRLHQNPHHIWCCARPGWWRWCSKKLHQNCYPGRLVFSLLCRWGGIFKSWGGVPKSCPIIPTARWGGVPKVGVVLQKVVPESPRLDGVVFQKLGWCSRKLSQNPHSVYYYSCAYACVHTCVCKFVRAVKKFTFCIWL